MIRIVVNDCFGSFGLSHKATLRYMELKGLTPYYEVDDSSKRIYSENGKSIDPAENPELLVYYGSRPDFMKESYPSHFNVGDIPRDDPLLLQVLAELGERANGWSAKLEVVEIPDGVEWGIEGYDGWEWVAEKHRTWEPSDSMGDEE